MRGSRVASPASRSTRFKLLTTLAVGVLGLVIVEIVVRVFGLAPPPVPVVEGSILHASSDPALRFENRPGAQQVLIYRESRGGDPVHVRASVNSLGLRGPEIALEKAPGTLRIACLGDSHTWGHGVNDDQAWPAFLQEALAEAVEGRSVEVLNCGVDGYDTLQEVVLLKERVMRFQPDLVLLQYHMNDAAVRATGGAPLMTRTG